MAAMTLADIRAYVYSFLDIDSNDLPTSVLDRIVEQAWNRIIRSERRWSFYEQTAQFVSAPTVQEYSLAGLGNVEWRDLVAVSEPTWGPLRPIAHVAARRRFAPNTNTGRPTSFSFHRNALWLWPNPSGVLTYTVDGYRQPTDWMTLGTAPDAPAEFHPLIAQYALSLAYGQQDDPSGAEQTMARFELAFSNARQEYVDDSTAGPIILNGGEGSTWYMPSRLRDRSDFF